MYRASRHERKTPAHGRFREATLFIRTTISLPFVCPLSYLFVDCEFQSVMKFERERERKRLNFTRYTYFVTILSNNL